MIMDNVSMLFKQLLGGGQFVFNALSLGLMV